MCKKELLMLDFEGILKYFRVSLPKKCRSEEAAKNLMKLACSIKVKKLKKYEADFIALKGMLINIFNNFSCGVNKNDEKTTFHNLYYLCQYLPVEI